MLIYYFLVPRVFEIRSISQKCVFKIELKFGFRFGFFPYLEQKFVILLCLAKMSHSRKWRLWKYETLYQY